MAKSDAIWGIDVGQCALKALRCRAHSDGKRLIADAYDFIEYPKILSQPDADPAALVADAIEQFLSRNDVKGERVAISVSGQSGLARFIKLPPVESKKIPDIVKFEARQQIPFALEDVVWDFQQMPGGSEEDGYALETEVGLFAMKRDQVFRALRPFTNANLEIDIVQLTPIALFNYILFDQMQNLPPPEEFDPENPPESIVVMSMGTDTTDLVVTNGYRVWQRSIPLGGNHFTKAITKEMKVTFTKAEHLKRTALKTDEAKAIFQAMRPTFNDLVTEVQRSISFFMSLNKSAKLGKIVALGNTMKLRGLQKYLSQNLGLEVVEVEQYRGLTGAAVVDSPAFKDNVLAFGVCYGLCVQGTGRGVLSTNLLPDEILSDRLVRAKKPWALAAVAALLVGCGVGYTGYWWGWSSSRIPGRYDDVFKKIDLTKQQFDGFNSDVETQKQQLEKVAKTAVSLAGISERRVLWPEIMKALTECLPKEPRPQKGEEPQPISKRNELHVLRMDCEFNPSMGDWFKNVQDQWKQQGSPTTTPKPAKPAAAAVATDADGNGADTSGAEAAATNGDAASVAANAPAPDATMPPATEPTDGAAGDAAVDAVATGVGPSGEGFVIEIYGHHYHNDTESGNDIRGNFVRNTLIKNILSKQIELPYIDERGQAVVGKFTMKELGVDFPVVVYEGTLEQEEIGEGGVRVSDGGGYGRAAGKTTVLQKARFVVQLAWKPTPATERINNRKPPAQPKDETTLAGVTNAETGSTP
jgi:type IV pilus assembly protein PilM